MQGIKVYKKDWSELKTIIDNNSFYWYPEDVWLDELKTEGLKEIICIVNDFKAYFCKIQIKDVAVENSEQKDYEDNYKDREGRRNYLRDSKSFTAAANTTTAYEFKLKDQSGAEAETFIFKGRAVGDSNAEFDDSYKIEIVDKDGVHYPAGTALHTFVKNDHIIVGESKNDIIPPSNNESGDSKKKLPSWAYLKVSYTSTGVTNPVKIKVGADYEYK